MTTPFIKHKILIVDDRPENLYSLECMLAEDDRIILKAESGDEALKIAFREELSLILLDVQMPEMDGFEATRRIRSMSDPLNKTKIMAMTANVTSEEVNKCFEAGMNAYISKPFETQDLLNKLGRLVLGEKK